ncbi:unnamed protein product [Spirodela intermedia]|uniref:Uncharacterized protein n=1 Tax=Spirodela intermedia TaxID=51605 RepID=A0A7I8JKJ6_SPIIN|nr:unnamed protein product [Spirodela intermedia]CAA6670361.1 unnamed protein product [Spirodela intermedia]
MAQTLSQAVIRESIAQIRELPRCSHLPSLRCRPPSSSLVYVRWRSGRSEKFAQVFEFVLEAATEGGGGSGASSSESTAARGEAAARRLEDVIHGILVRRSAPDWLPFVPGSSYWVPPRIRSYKLVEVLEKVSSPMTEEEVMSLTTAWGWPCSSHLVGGYYGVNSGFWEMSGIIRRRRDISAETHPRD